VYFWGVKVTQSAKRLESGIVLSSIPLLPVRE
jgi:hypothetical protein